MGGFRQSIFHWPVDTCIDGACFEGDGMNTENITVKDVVIWKLTFVITLISMFFVPPEHNTMVFFLTLFVMLISIYLTKCKVIGINTLGKILFFLLQILVATWVFLVVHNL